MSWLDPLFRAGYRILQAAGVAMPQQVTLNFASGFVVTDNPSNNRTDVSIGGTIANPTFTGTVTNNATLTLLTGDAKAKPQTATGNIQTSNATPATANLYAVAVGEVYAVDVIITVSNSTNTIRNRWKLSCFAYGAAGPTATLDGAVDSDTKGTPSTSACTLVVSGSNIQLQVTGIAATTLTWTYEAHVQRAIF